MSTTKINLVIGEKLCYNNNNISYTGRSTIGLNSHTVKFRSGEPPHSCPFFIIIICKKTRGKNEKKN